MLSTLFQDQESFQQFYKRYCNSINKNWKIVLFESGKKYVFQKFL